MTMNLNSKKFCILLWHCSCALVRLLGLLGSMDLNMTRLGSL